MKVAYCVSRFPAASETFVLRELNAVADLMPEPVELLSLFRATDSTVHPEAAPWIDRLRRPGGVDSISALLWWVVHRPTALIGILLTILTSNARRPSVAIRSLAVVPLAARHARTVSELGIDHVHAHFATYPALCAWICGRLAGVSYSFTAHAHDIFIHQWMLEEKVDDASFVVAISEHNRRFIQEKCRASETPIEVVHCGVEPARYPFAPRRPASSGPVRALCVGALRESKGHEVLLAALAEGAGAIGRIEVSLAGDGPLREELEREAASLGLDDRITFLGALTEPVVADALAASDLFVLPSVVLPNGDMEGIPVALMEAMACGLVTIASRMSGIPELIVDGETGLLATPGDAGSLQTALQRALDAADEIDLVKGRELIEAEFDIARSADRLVAMFERVNA